MADSGKARRPRRGSSDADGAVEATMRASRALLGIAARSLAPVLEQASLPQFRVLVLLHDGGSMRSGVLAEYLGVHPSTFTRMADRLVSFGWVERQEAPDNRREVHVRLLPEGAQLVEQVMRRRWDAIAEILNPLDESQRRSILLGLETLAAAAGEPAPEDLATFGG